MNILIIVLVGLVGIWIGYAACGFLAFNTVIDELVELKKENRRLKENNSVGSVGEN